MPLGLIRESMRDIVKNIWVVSSFVLFDKNNQIKIPFLTLTTRNNKEWYYTLLNTNIKLKQSFLTVKANKVIIFIIYLFLFFILFLNGYLVVIKYIAKIKYKEVLFKNSFVIENKS